MKIEELIRRLQMYKANASTTYSVRIVDSSLIVTKHTETDEIEVPDED